MKDFIELIVLLAGFVILYIVGLFLLTAFVFALMSPLIFVVWLITQAV